MRERERENGLFDKSICRENDDPFKSVYDLFKTPAYGHCERPSQQGRQI